MTVRFKVLIYLTYPDRDGVKCTHQINRTSTVFTTDELQHFKKFGYIIRPYSVYSSNYWFISEMEYRGTKDFVSWLTSSKSTILEIISQHKEQIITDINMLKDFGSLYY